MRQKLLKPGCGSGLRTDFASLEFEGVEDKSSSMVTIVSVVASSGQRGAPSDAPSSLDVWAGGDAAGEGGPGNIVGNNGGEEDTQILCLNRKGQNL